MEQSGALANEGINELDAWLPPAPVYLTVRGTKSRIQHRTVGIGIVDVRQLPQTATTIAGMQLSIPIPGDWAHNCHITEQR